MHKFPQCENREFWGRQLTAAHWVLLAVGFFIVIFTDRVEAGGFIILGSLGLFLLNTFLDIRHVRWHLKQMKGDDDM